MPGGCLRLPVYGRLSLVCIYFGCDVSGVFLTSFVLNTCVNLPHQAHVTRVVFRPRRLPSDDEMPVAVTSCVDGNFKLWSLSADIDVLGECLGVHVTDII